MGYDDPDWDEPVRFDYPVRLPGHDLRSEGSAYSVPDCQEGMCAFTTSCRPIRMRVNGTGGSGHALCSCGATSPHLPSAAKRKTWHRDHKRDVAVSTVQSGLPTGKA